MLVVKSKIKEHAGDLNVAGDFAESLDKELESLIAKACERAKANGRKTVQARDL
jgi:histone H3/H4|tara:strand:+ start:1670 stop:1831 length:162 start_codon:yes stop_codon:yes gene_type:complete